MHPISCHYILVGSVLHVEKDLVRMEMIRNEELQIWSESVNMLNHSLSQPTVGNSNILGVKCETNLPSPIEPGRLRICHAKQMLHKFAVMKLLLLSY
jgi:hypothetical protein